MSREEESPPNKSPQAEDGRFRNGSPRPVETPVAGGDATATPQEMFTLLNVPDYFVAVSGLPIHLPLHPAFVFRIAVDGGECAAAFKRVQAQRLHERTGIEKAQGMEFVNDRRGELVYSTADVKVPLPVVLARAQVDSVTGQNEERCYEVAEAIVLEAVNAVLMAYRHLASAYHIRPVVTTDLFQFRLTLRRPSSSGLTRVQIFGRTLGIRPIQPIKGTSFHGQLQHWLVTRRPPNTVDEILLNARDLLEQRQLAHAVIEARTGLEIALDGALLSAMETGGVTVQQAATILRCRISPGIKDLRDVLRGVRIQNKLGRGCRRLLGLELLGSFLGRRWWRAKKLREGAVHYGHFVSQADASDAVDVMIEMAKRIRSASQNVGSA